MCIRDVRTRSFWRPRPLICVDVRTSLLHIAVYLINLWVSENEEYLNCALLLRESRRFYWQCGNILRLQNDFTLLRLDNTTKAAVTLSGHMTFEPNAVITSATRLLHNSATRS